MSSTVTRRQRNPRGSGAQLRQDILIAARELLVETGSESAVTLRAVARRVGIAAPSIYLHFDKPEQIVAAVVAETFELLRAHIAAASRAATTPQQRLVAGCRAYIAFGTQNAQLYGLLFARRRDMEHEQPPAPPEAGGVESPRAFGFLMTGVRQCVEDGSSGADSVMETAVQLWVGMHGLVELRANRPDFPWPDPDRTETELIARLAQLHDVNDVHGNTARGTQGKGR